MTYALYDRTSGGRRDGNMMRSQYADDEAENIRGIYVCISGRAVYDPKKPGIYARGKSGKNARRKDPPCKGNVKSQPDHARREGVFRGKSVKLIRK